MQLFTMLLMLLIGTSLTASAFNPHELFNAIRGKDNARLSELLKLPDANVNYQLAKGELHGTALEEGMTPLLYALSLERIESAKIILEEGVELDVNLTNHARVNAVHMLAMIEVGDERYDHAGDEGLFQLRCRMKGIHYHAFSPIVLPSHIIDLLNLLAKRGFTAWGPFRTAGNENDQNLITEAFVHGKPYLARALVVLDVPMPDETHSFSLSKYLNAANLTETGNHIREMKAFLVEFKAPDALTKKLLGASRIKELAINYFPEDSEQELQLNLLIKDLIQENTTLVAQEFTGFLDGIGSSLPESTQVILRTL